MRFKVANLFLLANHYVSRANAFDEIGWSNWERQR